MVILGLLLVVCPRWLKPDLLLVVYVRMSAAADGESVTQPLKPAAVALQLHLVALHETRALVAIVATAVLRDVVDLLWVKVVHWHQHIKILWATFEAERVKVAKHSGGGAQSATTSTNTKNCAPPHPIESFAFRLPTLRS
jgi:hypothetical protein